MSAIIIEKDVLEQCKPKMLVMDKQGPPEGVHRLLDLATAVPEKKDARGKVARDSFFQFLITNT